MSLTRRSLLVALAAALVGSTSAMALTPYTPVPVAGPPVPGPGLTPPFAVHGKEYSHDFDFSVFGPVPDPEQVIAWDGTGGTADTVDFSFTRPTWTPDQEVDAIANHRDALFYDTIQDTAHLVFSHDDFVATYGGGVGVPTPAILPSGGPIGLSNGNVIGGAGEVSVEISGTFGPVFPPAQFLWASQPEVNDMPFPVDVDGLEVWGPEPTSPGDQGVPVIGDSDKYSLDVDFPGGASVWNLSGTPYIGWPSIVTAVETLLGPVPPSAFDLRDGNQGRQAINLDALMVSDILGEQDIFDLDPFGPPGSGTVAFDQEGTFIDPLNPDGSPRGDAIIFSIRQIVDPADPDGYYSTGSELFVLDSLSGVSFLAHGGHLWDHAYSLTDLIAMIPVAGDINGDGVVDLADLNILGANWGGPGPAGDINGDGTVDLADLNILGANWGQMATSAPIDINAIEAIGGQDINIEFATASSGAVPEPTTALLAMVAIGACAVGRRN